MRRGIEHRPTLLLLIAGCCIAFLVADVVTPSAFDAAFTGLISLSIVTAQLTVICIWGTLVHGTFWLRIPWTLLLLAASWCAIAWGIRLENRGPSTDAILGAGLMWLFGFAVSFIPLKIAAICFGWRIIGPDTSIKRDYGIRDIMIGTLLLAMTLAVARAMLFEDDISLNQAIVAAGLEDADQLIAISIFGVISLAVKLPCIWISLGMQATRLQSGILAWIVYCLVLTLLEFGLLLLLLGDPSPDGVEILFGMIVGHQLMGAIILGVCFALRGLGYRLERSLRISAAGFSEPDADAEEMRSEG